eukprot:UN34639
MPLLLSLSLFFCINFRNHCPSFFVSIFETIVPLFLFVSLVRFYFFLAFSSFARSLILKLFLAIFIFIITPTFHWK